MLRYVRWAFALGLLSGAACVLDGAFDLEDACGNPLGTSGIDGADADGTLPIEGAAELDFDGATVTILYSDNAGDDRCIYEVSVTLQKGGEFSGCQLSIQTTPLVDADGALLVDSIDVQRTDSCPTWDLAEDARTNGDGPFGTVTTPSAVRGDGAEACYDDVVELRIERTDLEGSEGNIVIGPATILLQGSFTVLGQSASCPTPG